MKQQRLNPARPSKRGCFCPEQMPIGSWIADSQQANRGETKRVPSRRTSFTVNSWRALEKVSENCNHADSYSNNRKTQRCSNYPQTCDLDNENIDPVTHPSSQQTERVTPHQLTANHESQATALSVYKLAEQLTFIKAVLRKREQKNKWLKSQLSSYKELLEQCEQKSLKFQQENSKHEEMLSSANKLIAELNRKNKALTHENKELKGTSTSLQGRIGKMEKMIYREHNSKNKYLKLGNAHTSRGQSHQKGVDQPRLQSKSRATESPQTGQAGRDATIATSSQGDNRLEHALQIIKQQERRIEENEVTIQQLSYEKFEMADLISEYQDRIRQQAYMEQEATLELTADL